MELKGLYGWTIDSKMENDLKSFERKQDGIKGEGLRSWWTDLGKRLRWPDLEMWQ